MKKVIPLPISGQVYDDEQSKPVEIDLSHLDESFRLSGLLRQLGHADAAELARPIHLLGASDFKPAALMERLSDMAANCDHASIACMNADRLPEFVWFPDSNGVNKLVRLKLAGGHVLGLIGLRSDGSFTTCSEPGNDPLATILLRAFASGYQKHPEYITAEQVLRLNTPANFEPENAEHTLGLWTAITEKCPPLDIHDEITVPKEAI